MVTLKKGSNVGKSSNLCVSSFDQNFFLGSRLISMACQSVVVLDDECFLFFFSFFFGPSIMLEVSYFSM